MCIDYICILWVFAIFYRFHILALGHLVALRVEPSLGVFGLLSVQSTFWLLPCTRLVVVKHFIALFEWFTPFFTWIPLSFALGLDHTAHWCLWDFPWFWRTALAFKDLIVFALSEICVFTLLLSFLKVCLVHLAINLKKKQKTISFAFH